MSSTLFAKVTEFFCIVIYSLTLQRYSFQLIFGISVMVWVTAKARKELLKALNEANAKYGLNTNFNVV